MNTAGTDERGVQLLVEVGWTPDRSVDIESSLQALRDAGFEVWDELADFLRAYSGLRIDEVETETLRRRDLQLDAEEAVRHTGSLELYEKYAATRLAPIGMAEREHLLLMLGRDGCIYGGYARHLSRIGQSIAESVANIVEGGPVEDMDVPTWIRRNPGPKGGRAMDDRTFGFRSNKRAEIGRQALEAAGWSEERTVDVSEALAALESSGFTIWPALAETLQTYSGLAIPYVDYRTGKAEQLWIDGGVAASSERVAALRDDPERLPRYVRVMGWPMTPIGAGADDELWLLLSDDGPVFCDYRGVFAELGDTLPEAIGALIEETQLEETQLG